MISNSFLCGFVRRGFLFLLVLGIGMIDLIFHTGMQSGLVLHCNEPSSLGIH